jgi:tetratricopeptide (TPR) repeat protein
VRALALLLLAGCTFPTPQQQQRSYAESLRPAEVKPALAASNVPLRKLRVRAYADADYQQQTPRWNVRIEQQVERASGILERQFGVRLELDSVRPWQRARVGQRLQDAVDELAASDPGTGVDWVVGFVSSLRVFSATQEDLGAACMFCRHFVLRGMFSAAESDAIDHALPLLSATERETLARERRVHRETALFLHEWAHTLGAFHERSLQSLMAPTYDTGQSAFSQSSARIVGLGLEYRDAPASRPTWSKAYRAEVERSSAEAWDAGTRNAALSAADYLAATAGERPKQTLPDADAAVLQKAVALEMAEDYGRAELALAPLIERYPYNSEVQTLACTLAQKRRARLDALVVACRPAARLPDAPAHLLLVTAHALLAQAAPAEAAPLLARAEQKLGDHPEGWLYLAQLQFEAGACSAAERAAARAKGQGGGGRVAEECARMRHIVGFPSEAAAVPAERESDYVSSALAAHRSIEDRKLDQARSAAERLRQAFPGTPAAGVIECRAASRGRELAPIKQLCAAVARQAPDAFYPQYTLGLVASTERRWEDAHAALQRAVELDDAAPPVWQSLAAVKQKIGDTAGLRDLQRRFLAKFKASLRPLLWPAGWKAR